MDIQVERKMTQPVKVLWGEHGAVGKCFDVMSLWQERALHLSGEALPCGHYIAEELPQQLSDQALEFFKD
jgi:haloacetate dehalogenase